MLTFFWRSNIRSGVWGGVQIHDLYQIFICRPYRHCKMDFSEQTRESRQEEPFQHLGNYFTDYFHSIIDKILPDDTEDVDMVISSLLQADDANDAAGNPFRTQISKASQPEAAPQLTDADIDMSPEMCLPHPPLPDMHRALEIPRPHALSASRFTSAPPSAQASMQTLYIPRRFRSVTPHLPHSSRQLPHAVGPEMPQPPGALPDVDQAPRISQPVFEGSIETMSLSIPRRFRATTPTLTNSSQPLHSPVKATLPTLEGPQSPPIFQRASPATPGFQTPSPNASPRMDTPQAEMAMIEYSHPAYPQANALRHLAVAMGLRLETINTEESNPPTRSIASTSQGTSNQATATGRRTRHQNVSVQQRRYIFFANCLHFLTWMLARRKSRKGRKVADDDDYIDSGKIFLNNYLCHSDCEVR